MHGGNSFKLLLVHLFAIFLQSLQIFGTSNSPFQAIVSLIMLLPYPPLLHLIKNVIAGLLKQTLLQLSAHQPFIVT
jgi:hypothetical protein